MTKDQFLLVVRFYQHILLSDKDGLGGVNTPYEAPHEVAPSLAEEQLRHALFMLERMEAMHEQDPEKAMRWLGFIQGVFWSLGIYTIDEMRVHNTNPNLLKYGGLC